MFKIICENDTHLQLYHKLHLKNKSSQTYIHLVKSGVSRDLSLYLLFSVIG